MNLSQLPDELQILLDGSLPEAYLHQAIRLSSVGENGWPYAAQLSFGEIIAVTPQLLLFAIWPRSTTCTNLQNNAKATLALIHDGAVIEVQAQVHLRQRSLGGQDLCVFNAHVCQVIAHRAPYATVTGGMTFTLHNEEEALTRWRSQIAALRQLARQ